MMKFVLKSNKLKKCGATTTVAVTKGVICMRFKTDKLRAQFYARDIEYNFLLHPVLHQVIAVIDRAAVLCGLPDFHGYPNGIMVTSLFRPGDKKLHGDWKAIDVRDWDWSPEFRTVVKVLLHNFRKHNPSVQHEFEVQIKNKAGKVIRGQHLHLEFHPKGWVSKNV